MHSRILRNTKTKYFSPNLRFVHIHELFQSFLALISIRPSHGHGGRYFARWQPRCIKSEAVRTQECSRTIQCTLLPGHHVCFAYVKHSTLTCEMRVYDVMYIDSELILCLHHTSVTSEAGRTQECSRTIQCTLLPGHHRMLRRWRESAEKRKGPARTGRS